MKLRINTVKELSIKLVATNIELESLISAVKGRKGSKNENV